ncbi:uncharacterized protein LOC112087252 [Eutrema salsugineum]|uniref:uncharacterized protein LOC112087252 n=1 Tax=Eutrema salsugineum TaxID=72664 RepID=UPI000CED0B83|nr:uncharacterized protein LOC112087252 [Eutrema salsugineum]
MAQVMEESLQKETMSGLKGKNEIKDGDGENRVSVEENTSPLQGKNIGAVVTKGEVNHVEGQVPATSNSEEKGESLGPPRDLMVSSQTVDKGKSWTSVVKDSPSLQKFEVDVAIVDGVETISVPDSVFDNPPLWTDCIVGKLMSKAPHVGSIHMIVNKIWSVGGKAANVEVFVVDDSTVKFRIRDASIRTRVLNRRMWNIKNVGMVVFKWSPLAEEAQPELTSMPLWVTFKNVPRSLYSWAGLSFLTSPLGMPKKLHLDTLWAKNFDEAKVFVDVDLTKKLPNSFNFKLKNGKETCVNFEFPWLPPRCTLCGTWGHHNKECLAGPGTKEILRRPTSPKKAKQSQIPIVVEQSSTLAVVEKTKTVMDSSSKKEVAENSNTNRVAADCTVVTPDVSPAKLAELPSQPIVETNKANEPEKLQCVSPNKVGRQKTKAHEDIELVTNTRYLALSNDEELETEASQSGDNEADAELRDDAESIRSGSKNEEKSSKELGTRQILPHASKTVTKTNPANKSSSTTTSAQKTSETRVKEAKSASIFSSVFNGWSFKNNYEHHRLGRIWVVWKDMVRVTPVFKSSQMISVLVKIPSEENEFLCSFVYASNFEEDRKVLWDDLQSHSTSPVLRKLKWVVMGDFNEIAAIEERSNSDNYAGSDSGMYDFQDMIRDCRFTDMGRHGPLFTWGNKRSNDLICKKLDRVMINDVWLMNSPSSYIVFETVANFWKNTSPLFVSTSVLCTRAYHCAVKARTAKNGIREIKTSGGEIVTNQEEIKEEAVRFFEEFLNKVPTNYQHVEEDFITGLLDFKCSSQDQEFLIREVTEKEVHDVLFGMASGKSPGPDGYTVEFYKAAWPIIGKDFVISIQAFFTKGFLPKGVNSTILAPIPKKEDAMEMKDYRPISCCNVLYKVISKILANRLKLILPLFIAPNQSPFVKDRLLVENLLLASELVKYYHKESISPRCAMKIDISKAFDSVQWDFLIIILQALGFPTQFIHWINLCISSASFSVQVNGELAGYFGSRRGLRQGCSLSPYLFVICMNILSKMIDKAAAERRIGYHPHCKKLELTHLCFADYLMVFSDGSLGSMESIISVFNDFATISGLHVSLEKSTVYLAGVAGDLRATTLENVPFVAGTLPVRYLGLPLLTKKMTRMDYAPLIDGPELNTKKAKVAWSAVCVPKKEGGLGLKNLRNANDVSVLKLLWRLLTSKESFWVRWIHSRYIQGASVWAIRNPTSSSPGTWMWKQILKIRERARDFLRMNVRNGKGTSFWFDHWSSMGPLVELTGERGYIDLGMNSKATVATSIISHRRRRHRYPIFNIVEDMIDEARILYKPDEDDLVLWRYKQDEYKNRFSTKQTWEQLREPHPLVPWRRVVWFAHNTPKFAFQVWIAILNRLPTGERMLTWSDHLYTSCVFCLHPIECRDHLFFDCPYTAHIWTALARGLLGNDFTCDWEDFLAFLICQNQGRLQVFTIKYLFHITIYYIWGERNARRHGEDFFTSQQLIKRIDNGMKNRFNSIRLQGDQKYEEGYQFWLAFSPL